MTQVCTKILVASGALAGMFLMSLPLWNVLYARYSGQEIVLRWRRVSLVVTAGAVLVTPAIVYTLNAASLKFKVIAGK